MVKKETVTKVYNKLGDVFEKFPTKVKRHQKREEKKKSETPQSLLHHEKQVYSQHGEDGIIAEIFKRIGKTNQFFVEFCIQTGEESNCRLLLEQGRKGLRIEWSAEDAQKAENLFKNYAITIVNEFITKDNIQQIFQKNNVPKDMDLLSIDIDGNDYHIWEAITDYEPRVVIIEYNAKYLPNKEFVMPYQENFMRDGSNFMGSSLKSLAKLWKKKGYTLVCCDSVGGNAFFVRDELINEEYIYI